MSITISALRTTENLWPNAIRRLASRTRPFAVVISPDGQSENISFADLENASNRAAWFLDQHCAEDAMFFYMGPSDIRYLIWALAAMKTGKCVVFPSPGNSVPANLRLFSTVGAKKFLFAAEFCVTSQPLQTATKDKVISLAAPSYAELLDRSEIVPVYPFTKTWDEIKLTKFMGLHTSGTSGHPKPIYWTHQGATATPAFLDASFAGPNGSNRSRDVFLRTTMLLPFPMFHMGGIASALVCVFCDNTLVLPKSGTPLSPPNYTAMLEYARCTATFAPPAVLEALLNYPPGLAALAKLDHVAYTGGPLQPSRGAELAKHVKHLFPILASTEGGPSLHESTGDSSHWNSFKFIDVGQRMEETVPGFYELVFPRNELVERAYGFFHVYPHLKTEYRTSDLLSPVKGDEGWWVYRGRTDSWVVMTNGLKMDPTQIENAVSSHSRVKGVLVAGSHRFRLCMLVEVNNDGPDQNETDFMDEIWSLVDKANKDAPKFGRVPRELIMTAKPDKPFLRASKGTIQRQLTIAAYEEEISSLYDRVEKGLLVSGLRPIVSTETQDLVSFLTDLHMQTLDLEDQVVGPDDDLISLGLDSLTAFVLLARLKAAFREYGVQEDQLHRISPKLLYSNSTVSKMAEALSALLNDPSPSDEHDETDGFVRILTKYTELVQALALKHQEKLSRTRNCAARETVILTGSTGSLGSYLLASLLSTSSVEKVICLNRGTAAAARAKQAASFQAKGLPPLPGVQDDRVSFVETKLSEPNLGLSAEEYADLGRRATCIIHNAFPVNWLLTVDSFQPQIEFLLGLLDLAGSKDGGMDFLFVSSIAAATPVNSGQAFTKILESVVEPNEAPTLLLRQGYAQAKYVCERLLEVYTSHVSSNISILRIGQICGPTSMSRGTWNPSEWFPSLVISSAKFVGAVPDSLGMMNDRIDWIPVDALAKIICELLPNHGSSSVIPPSDATTEGRVITYNIVHPQPTKWSDLLPALDSIVPKRIPPVEWVAQVEGSARERQLNDLHRNPALKLVDFYKQTLIGAKRGVVEVDSSNLMRVSETARSLCPISKKDVSSWVASWGL